MPRNANAHAAIRRLLLRICQGGLFDSSHVTIVGFPTRPSRRSKTSGGHAHETGELVLSVSGPMLCQLPGAKIRRFPPRHIIIVPAGGRHISFQWIMMKNARRSHWFAMHVNFGIININAGYGKAVHVLSLSSAEKHAWTTLLGYDPVVIFKRAAALVQQNAAWRDAYMDGFFKLFFASLVAVLGVRDNTLDRQVGSVVARALAFINAHYADPELALADIAAHVGLTRHYFATLFRKATGMTVWKKLLAIRLNHARGLVLYSKFSIKEAAALTGWSNQLYFSNAFHRHFGCSPTEARRRLIIQAHRRRGQRGARIAR